MAWGFCPGMGTALSSRDEKALSSGRGPASSSGDDTDLSSESGRGLNSRSSAALSSGRSRGSSSRGGSSTHLSRCEAETRHYEFKVAARLEDYRRKHPQELNSRLVKEQF